MTEMETRLLHERRAKLEKRFQQRYASSFTVREGQPCFQARNNHFFLITGLQFPKESCGALVIEHAGSLKEARTNYFEDGDLFWMDEMNEEEMFDAMIKEIEGQ